MVGNYRFISGNHLGPAVGQGPEGIGPVEGQARKRPSRSLLRPLGQAAVDRRECLRGPPGLQLPGRHQMGRLEGGGSSCFQQWGQARDCLLGLPGLGQGLPS